MRHGCVEFWILPGQVHLNQCKTLWWGADAEKRRFNAYSHVTSLLGPSTNLAYRVLTWAR